MNATTEKETTYSVRRIAKWIALNGAFTALVYAVLFFLYQAITHTLLHGGDQ